MDEATARSALISFTNSSFGSAPLRQVKVLSVVSSPTAPPETFHDITKLLPLRAFLARNQLAVMNSQVVSEKSVRKPVVVIAACPRHFSAKGQGLFINFAMRLPIINCNHVIAAVPHYYVFPVRRDARGVNPVKNSPSSNLQRLQHVMRAGRRRLTREGVQQRVHSVVITEETREETWNALEKTKLGKAVERDLEHAVTATAGDVENVIVDLDIGVQVTRKLCGGTPGARDLCAGQIDLVDVFADIAGRPVHPVLMIGNQ